MTDLVDVPSDFAAIDALLAFVAIRSSDATLHASGSGVLIAPGLALTAKHVLKDYSDRLGDPRGWRHTGLSSPFGIQAIQYRTDGPSITWDVWSASFHEPLDIAVVQLAPRTELPNGFRHVSAALEGAVPKVGDRVQAFGFSRTSVVFDERRGWLLNARPEGAVGQVTQVFPKTRDSVSMPFPACEMNMQVLGGMSGGPVFHDNGRVCGILCSSIDFADGTSHVSFASLIRPAVSLRLRMATNLGIWNGTNATLADLASARDIDLSDLDAI